MKCDFCGIEFDELNEKHYVSRNSILWLIQEHEKKKNSDLHYLYICPKCGNQYYDGLSLFQRKLIQECLEDGMSENEIQKFMQEI